ncbi:MAG: signal peptide peptidase SppA [Alphaproteobacteria bacterium]|nr:signal peptide peptidase SppA [Alphaproteobacteria bacterium]
MRKFGKYIKSFCTVLGALVITGGIAALFIGWYNNRRIYIPPHTMIMVDMNHNFSEVPTDNLLDEILDRQSMSFQKLIKAIEIAAVDDRIDAIIARIDVSNLEMAQIQDIARAVTSYKTSGKPAYVFSQGFGPLGRGNREYYLATFFDKIYMQPHTSIGITGISIEVPFFKKLMDKIGVDAEFYTRYQYKTAMASFTDDKMSEPFREEMQNLGNELMNEIKSDIKNNRKLTQNIDDLINNAPISSEDGVKFGLIDELMYLPQLEEKLKGEGAENFISIEDYASQIYPNTGNIPTIAYLNLNGIINTGETSSDIDGEYVLGSQSVLADISEIEDINNLKAVIVRIDSPGGSYNAADEIYFALKQLKKNKNIPIIVSQSGYAASGGYFISLAGDYIIAEPTTITGSIGVLGGKFTAQKLWEKLDISWDGIKIGNNAGILSINTPFSDSEKENFNASLDEVYKDFTAKVMENRKLTKNIDEIARGRVWSGRQALELGLVDALGGLDDALLEAKKRSNIKPKQKFKIISYPREKSFSEKLRDLILSGNAGINKIIDNSSVDIRYLKLFKRCQYDTVLLPFSINM